MLGSNKLSSLSCIEDRLAKTEKAIECLRGNHHWVPKAEYYSYPLNEHIDFSKPPYFACEHCYRRKPTMAPGS